jgi:RNase H-fold protein (predicted Holliday junction resolvase)
VIVLGLDPGTRKCGYALVGDAGTPILLGITPLEGLSAELAALTARHPVDIVALGGGTNCAQVAAIVSALGLRHALVDERETTLRARGRFFADHPPRGWKRFMPRGMLLPDRPIDDYAALLIAERFLTEN